MRFLGYAPNNGAMAEFICVPKSAVHVVPDSIDPAAAAILKRHPTQAANAICFWNRGAWIDVPFAYDPWWESRSRTG